MPTIPDPRQLVTEATTKLHTLRDAHARRDRPARASGPRVAHGPRAAALRHDAGRRLHRRGPQPRRRARRDRRARDAVVPRGRTSARTRSPTRCAPTGSRRATTSRSCAATTAAGSTPCVACSKLGANALFLNTAFSGPQLADVAKREKPKAVIYDHEFAEVLKDAVARRKRYIAWHEPEDGKVEDPLLDELIARGDTADVSPPEPAGPGDHPHVAARRARRRAPSARCPGRSTRSPRCCR